MQPHNQEQEGTPVFLLQAVLGAIGFVVIILVVATVFVSSNSSDRLEPSFAAVAADSPPTPVTPIPIAPTTAVPPTVLPRNVGDIEVAAPATSSTTSTSTSTTSTTTILNGRAVPDVTGLEINEAILEIIDWKLGFSRIDHSDDQIPAGIVIETRPAAGMIVAPGTSVLLIVSTGPE